MKYYYKFLKKHFNKNNIIPFIISFVLTAATFVAIVTRLFYPYHVHVGLGFYLASWVIYIYPFIHHLSVSRIKKNKKFKFFKKYYIFLIGITFFLIFLYLIFSLFPVNNIKIAKSEIPELMEKLDKDTIYLKETLVSLDKSYEELINSELLGLDMKKATPENTYELKTLFAKVVDHIIILENFNEEYKYFYQINYFKYPELNIRAFVIAYTSYLTKYKVTINIANEINNNYFVEMQLNEVLPGTNISNSYMILKNNLYYPSTSAKIEAGNAYIKYIKQFHSLNDDIIELMEVDSKDYYDLLGDTGKISYIKLDSIFDTFETHTMDQWLPIQKSVSNLMGETRIKTRHHNIITIERIQEVYEKLEPGDIIFQRRNWYVSNAGMPGFWTHAALYVGTLDVLDEYFEEEAKELLGMKVSEYVKINFPKLYEDKNKLYEGKYPYTTIEGKAEGIIILPLEVSATSDYFAAIRPKLSKMDKLKALLYTFDNYLKPYDYNFDFASEDVLVCSELVYKAYLPSDSKEGLNYELEKIAGRWMLAPNDMVRIFNMKYGTSEEQNEFVFFIDGNEETFNSEYKGVEEFRESWKRSKYTILLD